MMAVRGLGFLEPPITIAVDDEKRHQLLGLVAARGKMIRLEPTVQFDDLFGLTDF